MDFVDCHCCWEEFGTVKPLKTNLKGPVWKRKKHLQTNQFRWFHSFPACILAESIRGTQNSLIEASRQLEFVDHLLFERVCGGFAVLVKVGIKIAPEE